MSRLQLAGLATALLGLGLIGVLSDRSLQGFGLVLGGYLVGQGVALFLRTDFGPEGAE